MFSYAVHANIIFSVNQIAGKKPVGFLHWFHHATVLLFCWDAYRTHQTTGLYFIAMNYFVHAIMYFYYFLTACGYRPKWAPIVTTLQIVQMVIGMLVSFWHYYLKQYSGRRCHGSVTNLHFCFAMYLSYFALFMQFALRRYFWSKPKPYATNFFIFFKFNESLTIKFCKN